jgi:hypothetical protein
MVAPCRSFGDVAGVLPAFKHSHHRVEGGHNARLRLLSPMQRCVTIATRTAPATTHKILDLPQAKLHFLSLPLSSSHSWPVHSSGRIVPSFCHPSQPMASAPSTRARVERGEMRDSPRSPAIRGEQRCFSSPLRSNERRRARALRSPLDVVFCGKLRLIRHSAQRVSETRWAANRLV